MTTDEMLFFDKMPQALPLYEAFCEKLLALRPDTRRTVQKTQIAFANRYQFAFVWLPFGRVREHPDPCMMLSFGLPARLDSPRIWRAVEPYPDRWTHHVMVCAPEELDDELMGWVADAYDFSARKTRRK